MSSDDIITTNHSEKIEKLCLSPGKTGRKFRSDLRRISGHCDESYSLQEVIANYAAIMYVKQRDFVPIKISLANQAVDYVALYRLKEQGKNLLQYVLRFPLPLQPMGRVVPYSTPRSQNENFLYLTDDAKAIHQKGTQLQDLTTYASLYSELTGQPKSDDPYQTLATVGETLTKTTNSSHSFS